jgi:AcrR family transcriptional regulator
LCFLPAQKQDLRAIAHMSYSHSLKVCLSTMAAAISPRKLPRQARAKVTHDAILEAATHIISAGGLAAFNTNAVAGRAGVSIGSLYQYFPNKDSLMVALIHRQQTRQQESVAAEIAMLGSADLATAVRAIVRAAMRHHHDNSLYASAIDHEEERLPVHREIGEYLDRSGMFVRALLIRYASDVGSIDADRCARTLPALVRAVTDRWANEAEPQLGIAEDEAVRAVLGYLLVSKNTPNTPE